MPLKLNRIVLRMSRTQKRFVMVAADLLGLPLALWAAYALRFADWWPSYYIEPYAWLFLTLPPVGVFVFARLGLYRAVVRFMGAQAISAVLKGVGLLAVSLWAAAFIFQWQGFPRSIPINFALVALMYVGGTRFAVRLYYQWFIKHYSKREPVVIYGAGDAGAQLAAALSTGHEFYTAAFVDNDRHLWRSTIRGVAVHPPGALHSLIEEHGAKRLLLAMPSASKEVRKAVLERVQECHVHVQTIPSLPEIMTGEAPVDQLREVDIEDLLGRDPVPPRPELFDACIQGKAVMVTGAGGSIGSELCRQIIGLRPRVLVLYEISEFGLFEIERELRARLAEEQLGTRLVCILGSVDNVVRVRRTIEHFGIQVIFHAAAYKHVPMVEHNIFEGVRNNVIGTRVVAHAAAECGVERFVLISTDKAVRPTNVMGATKRFAELILQDLAAQGGETIFSMVRFGNVLGSSGSVVPLFRKQIAEGGPITVTHPEITRFFMTIPEAAQLVIQAGAMAEGGDVFVLDMGQPVKIVDLARRMVQLSGLEMKSDDKPDGDIEIVFSGLRPGEKLYEELLIGDNVLGTAHPKIMRAQEKRLDHDDLAACLADMAEADQRYNCQGAKEVLRRAVSEFTPSVELVDWLKPAEAVERGKLHYLKPPAASGE